jgi:DNA-binding beta-propeller fold protein YncE
MKKMTTRIATALLLGILCAAPAFAKAKSRLITVGQDFVVGATTVKAGTYIFSVDEATNELSVINKKTKEVIARAETRAQSRGKGPFKLDFQLVDNNGTQTLASIAFDGEKNSYTIAGTSTAAR